MEELGDPLGLRASRFGREEMRAFGFGLERGQAFLMECLDGVADRLIVTAEVLPRLPFCESVLTCRSVCRPCRRRFIQSVTLPAYSRPGL
jgi:hypothetical protein